MRYTRAAARGGSSSVLACGVVLALLPAACAKGLDTFDGTAADAAADRPRGDVEAGDPAIETDAAGDPAKDGDAGGDAPATCAFHADCDDGLYCNGAERCIGNACQPGSPVACADAVACTVDSCDEATKGCLHAPDDASCDDGSLCNGAERCDAARGCVPGTGAACNDGVACTWDSCDDLTGACTHTPNDALCDDGDWCNGEERCVPPGGCAAGTPPSCAADDGIACTVEECDDDTDACVHRPDDARCADAIFCNGQEFCDTAARACGMRPAGCDDGNACTIDTCNTLRDACDNVLIDVDGDSFPPASCGGSDCRDDDGAINPRAVEDCDDGVDNNCNTKTDMDDYGCCTGSNDTCVCPVDVSAGGTFTGTTADAADDYSGGCGSTGGKDRVFYLHLRSDANVTLATAGSSFDTLLYLRGAACATGTVIECDDDGGSGTDSLIERFLAAGDYFVFVDGYGGTASGSFSLRVGVVEIPIATPVTGNDQCAGAVNVSAGGCFSGSTASMRDDYDGLTCGSSGGKDVVFVMTLAAARTVRLDTNLSGISDTLLYVRQGTCTGTEVECDDDDGDAAWSLITRSFPAGTYYVFVDGYSSSEEGPYRLCVAFP